jgi:hypothetical protein
MGFFVEGTGFSWVSDGTWRITPGYTLESLTGKSILENDRLGIRITLEDSIHPVYNILLRRLHIASMKDERMIVRCFFHHDFHIYGDNQKDTAFYEPYTNSVIHYREKRYFLVGGLTDNPTECMTGHTAGIYTSVLHSMRRVSSCGISSFAIGKAAYRGLEGTWRDAEDGERSAATRSNRDRLIPPSPSIASSKAANQPKSRFHSAPERRWRKSCRCSRKYSRKRRTA